MHKSYEERRAFASKLQDLLNKRYSCGYTEAFGYSEREGFFCLHQSPIDRASREEPFRLPGLTLAVLIDADLSRTKVIAHADTFPWNKPFTSPELPKPLHQSEFAFDMDDLGHVAVAIRLEKLFSEITAIHYLSGIDHA